jgi:microcystin-dependent protein
MLKTIKRALGMSGSGDEYIGSIATFAGEYAPRGYVPCDGRLLAIKDHKALFSIISTMYGGDGVNTFAVPDLRPFGKDAPDTGKPRRLDWSEMKLPRQMICVEGLYPMRP